MALCQLMSYCIPIWTFFFACAWQCWQYDSSDSWICVLLKQSGGMTCGCRCTTDLFMSHDTFEELNVLVFHQPVVKGNCWCCFFSMLRMRLFKKSSQCICNNRLPADTTTWRDISSPEAELNFPINAAQTDRKQTIAQQETTPWCQVPSS